MPRGGRRLSRHEIDAVLRRLFPAKRWKGTVVRRDPDTVRQPSEIAITRCENCRHWTPKRLPECSICHVPFPITPSESHAR
jgi:hypothetical protein